MCKAVKNVQVLEAKKKLAWTDLDRVDFEKNFQRVNVQIEKSAWTGLGKVKRKASSAASVFKKFISTTGHGSAFDKRCSSATPFAVAFSLTFSLVKNLKMLLQAKRQPGYKIPGRVDDRAY